MSIKQGPFRLDQPNEVIELWNTMAQSKEQDIGHLYILVRGDDHKKEIMLVTSEEEGSDLRSIDDFIIAFINSNNLKPEQLFQLEQAYKHLFPKKRMPGEGVETLDYIHQEFEKKCKIELATRFGEFLKKNNIDLNTLKKAEGELLWALDNSPLEIRGDGQAILKLPIDSNVEEKEIKLIEEYASSNDFQKTFKNLFHVDSVNVTVLTR